MTFDDDFLQLPTPEGTVRFLCTAVNVSWPPPEIVSYRDRLYHLVRRSQLSDVDRESMSMIVRGAEYRRLDNVVCDHNVVPKIH